MGARWTCATFCVLVGCAGGGIDDVQQSSGLGTANPTVGSSATTASTASGDDTDTGSSDGGPSTTASSQTSTTVGDDASSDASGSPTTAMTDDSGMPESSGAPAPFCGDGNMDPGEACDDGNDSDTDACLSSCAVASCGDGFVQAGVEACDDANGSDTDACLSSCIAASCGDAFVQAGVEACDDAVNDGSYGGCNPGCAALGPYCGDGVVQGGQERCDGATGYAHVGCTGCWYDFSTISQLYCNGTCTWGGPEGCDQADADIYCRLTTGDSLSVATSFQVTSTLDGPGFACPGYSTNLGTFPEFGVNVNVWYDDVNLLPIHAGGIVVSSVTCS